MPSGFCFWMSGAEGPPGFIVSVASKGFSSPVSGLESTLLDNLACADSTGS